MKTLTGDRLPESFLLYAATAVTLVNFAAHLWMARHLQFAADEAYYVLWSRHLSWGYYDHPPLVAAWICASRSLFGDGEPGVRALGITATALGALLLYWTALTAFGSRAVAAFAVLLFNAALLMQVGPLVVTPDTPLVVSWSLGLFGLVMLHRDQDWRWWALIGVACGLALQAKYTGFFLGAGVAAAMATVPSLRRWWRHPAPYAAAALSLLIFAPVVVWNADHGWVSFAKQFGRTGWRGLAPNYFFELVAGQAGLLTPLTFILAVFAVAAAFRARGDGHDESRRLLASTALPALLYFAVHSLHDRVQGNWLAMLYPQLCILAADLAFRRAVFSGRTRRVLAWSSRWAVPVGLVMIAAVYIQAIAAPLHIPGKDPTGEVAGWRALAEAVDRAAETAGAAYILAPGYALTSELAVYGKPNLPVLQYDQRIRWTFAPAPDERLLASPALFVSEASRPFPERLRQRFQRVSETGRVARMRGDEVLATYALYRLEGPHPPVLDPVTTDLVRASK